MLQVKQENRFHRHLYTILKNATLFHKKFFWAYGHIMKNIGYLSLATSILERDGRVHLSDNNG